MPLEALGAMGPTLPRRSIPPRALVVLGMLVLVAHLAALRHAPALLDLPDPVNARPWIMRSIVLEPTPAAAPAAPVPTPQARTAAPRPVAQRAPGSDMLAATPATAPAAAPATPDAAAPAASRPAEPDEPLPAQPATLPTAPAEPVAAAPPPTVAEAAPPPGPPPRERTVLPAAYAVPGSTRLLYNVTGQARKQNYEARGELLWLHDGQRYEARLEVSAFLFGSRVQTSRGRIGADGLAPERFSDKSRSEQAAHFDPAQGRIRFSANTPDAPLLAGAQDRLSVVLQLAAMLAGDPARFGPATTLTIQVAGPREADNWLFGVEGEEAIRLSGNEVSALRLTRHPRREYDVKVELWFAPSLGYLPVRIRLTQPNGDVVDQQLRAVEKP